MLTDLRNSLRPAIVLLLLFAGLTGLAYPALITSIAQIAMPRRANGSLITAGNHIIGSELIAQGFTANRYFHPRPSAAGKGYDASSSGASNLAPGSKDLRDVIVKRIADIRAAGMTGAIPADLVTASASGLDPDISPAAAQAQVAMVAKARGVPVAQLETLIAAQTRYPVLGLIGEPHINVLMLNRQLDSLSATESK